MLLKEGAYMVCLIKPQFEAGREQVGKNGIIKDKKVLPVGIMIASFIAAFVFNVNVIYIIIVCAAIGVLFMRPERGRDK